MRTALLALVLLAPVAGATTLQYPIGPVAAWPDHDCCWGGDCDGYGLVLGEVEVGFSAGVTYVDDRGYATGNGLWVYEESNGIYHDTTFGDLQRGGSGPVPDDIDPCHDLTPIDAGPDTLIF